MKRRAGKYRKTYWVAGVAAALAVMGSGGCGRRESSPQLLMDTVESMWEDEITIMHVDAGDESFRAYIEELQTRLQMKINLLPYPANADSRHAKASSLLAAGDSSVDVFAVNDEMINAFKNEGYLEPLQDDVMDEETARAFEQEYLQETTMAGGQIYSAPYVLDILALWVNEEWMREAGLTGIETEEDFYRFLAHDWSNEKTRAAVRFSKECVDKGYTPKEQMIDQHEQMNQKFIDGKYGMVFMYTGGIKKYAAAGVYGKDRIHMAPLPDLGGRHVTYIGTWQYALNKASQHKEAARRFMSYAVSREGNRLYAEMTNSIPARRDLLEEELHIIGYAEIRELLRSVEMEVRPIPANSMEYIETVGELFQKYMLEELDLDSYCEQMQELVDENIK